MGGIKRTGSGAPDPGGNPPGSPECGCHWVDNGDGTYTCPVCGATWDTFDDINTCDCDPCRCPIDLNWGAMLFLASLAIGYGVYKKRTSHATVTSVMVTRC